MSILFKYMCSQRTLFDDGFIRASQLSALNDPFEAVYCKEGLDELVNNFDEPLTFDLDGKEITFSDYVEMHKNKIGVISFTEAKDNFLMWAHYANEHKGIVVGFSKLGFDNGIFTNLVQPISTSWDGYGPFHGVPEPVMYRKQPRYRIDKFDFDYSNISVEGADRILYEIFLQKSEEWIYEKEHRVILRLEQADKVKVFDIENIVNEHTRNMIIESEWCTFHDESPSFHEITLMDIEDDVERQVIAQILSELSLNRNNVYLFKLKPNAISHCLLGLNCSLSYQDVMRPYINSIGYYEVWKANQNKLNYVIEFKQLYE